MATRAQETRAPYVADSDERSIARAAAEAFRTALAKGGDLTVHSVDDPNLAAVVPARAAALVVAMLDAAADASAAKSADIELTSQEAAHFLNVSRPYLVRLVDAGKIAHRMVGKHRRIRMADLIAYKERAEHDRRRAVEAMVAEAQRLKLP